MIEEGYHKLSDPGDWAAIQNGGFRPSTPAEDHWLGEGVYFFLNPNGQLWAVKWPFRGVRCGQDSGILKSTIDISKSLDFRVTEIRVRFQNICSKFISKISAGGSCSYIDGTFFAMLLGGEFKDIFPEFETKVIIANFSKEVERLRREKSRILLTTDESIDSSSPKAQIQACVVDVEAILSTRLVK